MTRGWTKVTSQLICRSRKMPMSRNTNKAHRRLLTFGVYSTGAVVLGKIRGHSFLERPSSWMGVTPTPEP